MTYHVILPGTVTETGAELREGDVLTWKLAGGGGLEIVARTDKKNSRGQGLSVDHRWCGSRALWRKRGSCDILGYEAPSQRRGKHPP